MVVYMLCGLKFKIDIIIFHHEPLQSRKTKDHPSNPIQSFNEISFQKQSDTSGNKHYEQHPKSQSSST